eukprot:642976-Pelagomonas_calceolata.AAC.5
MPTTPNFKSRSPLDRNISLNDENSRKRTKGGQCNGGTRPKSHMALPTNFKLPDNNEYLVQCKLCQTSIQSRVTCISHEHGKKRKDRVASWQQAQKDRAAWHECLDKGAEYTAEQRAGQAADLKLHTLLASTFKHLQLGSSALHRFPTQQPLGNGWMPASVVVMDWIDEQEHTTGSIGFDVPDPGRKRTAFFHANNAVTFERDDRQSLI